MGIARMGQISDIGYHTLASMSDNFLRPETLPGNDGASFCFRAERELKLHTFEFP